MGRIDLHAIFKAQQTIEEALVERLGALHAGNSEVWTCHVADEERVAGQYQPGVLATAGVRDGQGDMLGPMAGRMHDAQLDHAKGQLITILEVVMGKSYVRLLMDVNARSGSFGQFSVTRNVVGVIMRLNHGCHAQSLRRGQRENLVNHVQAWIDDGTCSGVGTTHNVASTA